MRRRITLYIDGTAADLTDDALVLMTYAVSDVYNPAAVKNSYSQTVTLPGTATNNAIFGSSFRLDRTVGTGFNASQRVPFSIYAETGEVLVAGYCRLSRVMTAWGSTHSYELNLFGGLGEFLYEMDIASNGDKLTLADLDYGTELDFTIDKDTVADAWARLGGNTSKPTKWDVINFAPALNGIPSQGFSADKAVGEPAKIGLSATIDGHTTKGGYTLINLAEAVDEWAAKDLRSYLQRPVVSFRQILAAIARTSSWSVDLSDLSDVPFIDAWLTRPLLPSLGSYKQITGGVTVTPSGFGAMGTSDAVGRETLSGLGAGEEATLRISYKPAFYAPGASGSVLVTYGADATAARVMATFIQAVAYDENDHAVGASSVVSLYDRIDIDPETLASLVGFAPNINGTFEPSQLETDYDSAGSGVFKRSIGVELSVTATDIAYVEVVQRSYTVNLDRRTDRYAGSTAGPVLFDAGTRVNPSAWGGADPTAISSVTGATSIRSGAYITKQMLLTTQHSPADYLVSFCKMAGLYILADRPTKTVRILKRKSFYQATVIDLSERVDRSRDIEVQPIPFDAKWYNLRHDGVGGAFETEYKDTEGVQYGAQRVSTGYDFDAQEKDLLSGAAFRSCAMVRNPSKYLNYIISLSKFYPSPYLTPGGTYTLWDGDDALDTALPVPGAGGLTWYNADYPGFDKALRPEFRNAENAPIDGSDVLLMYNGTVSYPHVNLTDDISAMDTLNGGPCWLFDYTQDASLDIPSFTRFTVNGGAADKLLDFGIPRQVGAPDNFLAGATSLYSLAWATYIRDRLDVNNKILRCRVRLDGLQVGVDLLRRFFWYRGSLWALSKISNYSLTTFDPAECEFIQVRDITNYTTGQY